MNVIYHRVIPNCVRVNVTYEKVDELGLIENVFFRILKESFLNHNIKLVTREPQKYSFGYELKPHCRIEIDKIDTLVNDIINCNANLLLEVVQTEEFKRGLLILIDNVGDWTNSVISDVFKMQKGVDAVLPKATIAFCEDDGLTLLICNSMLSIDFLESIASFNTE